MLRIAKEKGLTVSFDGNFRSMLWSWEEARDFCTQCLPPVDILLGIEPITSGATRTTTARAT